jgi:hypothetical protein
VAPISSDPPVERVPSSTSVQVLDHANGTNNGSIRRRRSSMLSKGQLIRVSMDLSSAGALSFHNINYLVGGTGATPTSKICHLPCIKPKPARQILYDVSGVFTTGMNAIMGKKKSFSSSLDT